MKMLCLLLLLHQLVFPAPAHKTAFAMKTGILLRMHVIAQDDSAPMQQVKLCVRDAVRQAYAQAGGEATTMLRRARALLPELTLAARRAAQEAGFTGPVQVSLSLQHFGPRTLDGLTFPPGTYPALVIRLGEAQGRNWWGLIDPETALACAALPGQGEPRWDWSLSALWQALWPFSQGKEAAGA